ncbi:MAG: hypothetical protein CMJ48_08020 [Planctomycetaceae bacterium]|nr:hypothetical protein [Planctomycetaceae bacterium]
MKLWKMLLSMSALAVGLVVGGPVLGEEPGGKVEKVGKATLRVGTFDSRAVLFAYVDSEFFKNRLKSATEEHKKAKEAGDDAKAKRIAAGMKAGQERVHRASFSTGRVDEILVHIKDKLPGIAKKAGVDVIVSKWSISYSAADAEFVDVTGLMIEPFGPNEKKRATILEQIRQPPIPLEKWDRERAGK